MISTEKEFETFEKLTEAFGFGQLQDVITVKEHLEEHEYTLDDLDSFIEYKGKVMEEHMEEGKARLEEYEKKMKPSHTALIDASPACPKCDTLLIISPIKTEEGIANKHGYKAVWQCTEEDCTYEKFETEEPLTIIKELIGEDLAENFGYVKE